MESEVEVAVELFDAGGELIGESYGAWVFFEPVCEADLVVPAEAACRVLGEFDVVGRIGVDEVGGFSFEFLEVAALEGPLEEERFEFEEVFFVVDGLVAPEGDVVETGLVEAAEPVEAGSIEEVEKLGCFCSFVLLGFYELVEAFALAVEQLRVVCHFDVEGEAGFKVAVEVEKVGIDVVEDSLLGCEAKGDSETSAEGFDEAARCVF